MNPEVKVYKKNKKLHSHTYRNEDGIVHREDGPAYKHYDLNGNVEQEIYVIDGKEHREDGPAKITITYEYFLNGKKVLPIDLLINKLNKVLKPIDMEIKHTPNFNFSTLEYEFHILKDGNVINTCKESELENILMEYIP